MNTKISFSTNQIGALITLVIVAVWGVWVSWLHLTRPLGVEFTEILFLGALSPIYLILLPLYALRIRWSYISGIIVMLGLYIGLIKSVTDHTFFFSLSAYNLTTIAVLLSAAACIYFSLRSYLELPSIGWLKGMLGIGILLAISVLLIWQVSKNQMRIENLILEGAIHGVQARTGDIMEVDEKIKALMAEGDIPAMVIAIVVKDEIVLVQGYGEQADVEKLFDIGSITKSIVATAVLQLYEQQLIDLDDDVNQYLPFQVRHPNYPNVPITIRMLLSHRSCLAHNSAMYYAYSKGPVLTDWGVKNRGWDNWEGLEQLSYPEFLVGYLEPGGSYYLPENWANCRPGTSYIYSTPGFDLLGYLVELVSGQALDDYLQENILTPLEMTSSTSTPLSTPERMATPFERWYGVLAKTNVQLPYSQRRIIGGGGLYATAGDLSNFLLAHMNGGEFKGFQLLQPETVNLMHRSAGQASDDFMQVGYGYGWSIYQEEPRQMWEITFQPRGFQGHGGRYWGYSSVMSMVEENDGAYGYILLMNLSMTESMDPAWLFSIQLNLQDLILSEAYRMYHGLLSQ